MFPFAIRCSQENRAFRREPNDRISAKRDQNRIPRGSVRVWGCEIPTIGFRPPTIVKSAAVTAWSEKPRNVRRYRMYGAWIALGRKYCRACSANAIQHVVVVISMTPPFSNHRAASLRMKSRSTESRMATAANMHPAVHASSGASIRAPLEDSGMRRPQNRLIARTDHEDIGSATTNAATRAAALSGAKK